MADDRKIVAGIDIGAGSGTKIGILDLDCQVIGESVLPIKRYGENAQTLVSRVCQIVRELVAGNVGTHLCAVGVGSPGTVKADGMLRSACNLPFLADADLSNMFAKELGVPAVLINDADAGALAEWYVHKIELLYWVFGGGWGGAWVSADGEIRFSSRGWDGNETRLHYTNEPGFATPLQKRMLEQIFAAAGLCFKDCEKRCAADNGLATPFVGPAGKTGAVRAELFVSGTGRWRIFREFALRDETYKTGLSSEEIAELERPETAGRIIDKLGYTGTGVAVRTDKLFGAILAEAAMVILHQATDDGCPDGVPIFLAGKPSRALPLFGSFARKEMLARGIENKLYPSKVEANAHDPNMIGAAVMAARLLAQ
ncbi:MAG: ROK family protein [Lentisphaerae bacterium]|nr:ROK family protein [Lentisphaerota bacterium]